MAEKTLAIVKPDAVDRNVIGQIVSRAEATGLSIIAAKMVKLTTEQAEGFYQVHREKAFFESLTRFMSEGPILVMVLQGDDAISRWREVMGATDPSQAREGSIRESFGLNVERNSVHGSDSPETARFEIGYFFEAQELVEKG